jgi:hypothetical protein
MNMKTAMIGGGGSGLSAMIAFSPGPASELIKISLAAIPVIVAVYWMCRIKRAELQQIEQNICSGCVAGHPPPECPIPMSRRPSWCLRKTNP